MMIWVDLAIVAIIVGSIGYGLTRGGLYELLNLLSWLAAFFAAYYYQMRLSSALEFYIQDELVRSTLSFGVIFFIGYIIASLLVSIIHQIFRHGPPGSINRLLGLLIGGVRGWILVVIALFLIELIGLGGGSLAPSDRLAPYFNPGINWLTAQLPDLLEWMNSRPEPELELPALPVE